MNSSCTLDKPGLNTKCRETSDGRTSGASGHWAYVWFWKTGPVVLEMFILLYPWAEYCGSIFCLHFMLIILFQRNVRNGHKLTWIVYRCFTRMEREKKGVWFGVLVGVGLGLFWTYLIKQNLLIVLWKACKIHRIHQEILETWFYIAVLLVAEWFLFSYFQLF